MRIRIPFLLFFLLISALSSPSQENQDKKGTER